ncbi:HAD family hydrolase [Rossellomorea sp. LJF3]|uniref:HAD family hydrolase n=1 Tax=Rossellomorea sp. LJF3 TaxID=3126099 RepID=UPI00300CAE77
MEKSSSNIKCIFFDAGGVLFDTFQKGDDRIRNLLEARGYQIEAINKAIRKAKEQKLSFITRWEEEEQYYKRFYGAIAEELGEEDLTNELLFFAHYAAQCELFPEVKEVLDSLSKKYRLGVISNAMPSMDWIFDKLNIRKYFDGIILSAFVNAEKPDETIYHTALNKLGATVNESIFIDDIIKNVHGAEQVGIKGVHLDRAEKNSLEVLIEENIL